jgi:hypothetical protein
VRVVARFRPLNENEKRKKDQTSHEKFDITFSGDTNVDIQLDKASHNFSYDKVYDWDSLQVYLVNMSFSFLIARCL